jgi:hypothetical protein
MVAGIRTCPLEYDTNQIGTFSRANRTGRALAALCASSNGLIAFQKPEQGRHDNFVMQFCCSCACFDAGLAVRSHEPSFCITIC